MESRNQEFSAVEALKLENKALNRYRDVYPYDHSRVPLTRYPCPVGWEILKPRMGHIPP